MNLMINGFMIVFSILGSYLFLFGTLLSAVYQRIDGFSKENKFRTGLAIGIVLGAFNFFSAPYSFEIGSTFVTSLRISTIAVTTAVTSAFFGGTPIVITTIAAVVGRYLQGGVTAEPHSVYLAFSGLVGLFIATRSWSVLKKTVMFFASSTVIFCVVLKTMYPAIEVKQIVSYVILSLVSGVLQVVITVFIFKKISVEREWKASEQRYTSLFENQNSVMIVLSVDYYVERINKETSKLFGCSEKEIVQQHFFTFFQEEFHEKIEKKMKLVRDGQAVSSTLQIVERDGKVIDTLWSFSPIIIDAEVVGITAVAKDITKLKETERKLEESQQHLRCLFTNHPDAVARYSFDGYIVDVNETICKMLGYNREEMIGQHFSKFSPPNNIEAGNRALEKANRLTEVRYEQEVVCKNGLILSGIVTIVPINIEGTLQGMYTVFTNLTAQKQIEQRLEESERRYRSIVQLSPEVLFVEKKGIIEFMNMEVVSFLKAASMSSVLAVGHSLVNFVHIKDKKKVTAYMKSVLDSRIGYPKDSKESVPSELRDIHFVCMDYSVVRADIAMKVIEDKGEIVLFGSIHDITRQKELEEELQLLSRTDQLTDVANRRYYDEVVDIEWKLALREGHRLSILMIDIDFFKNYNDFYGHQDGDKCIKKVVDIIKNSVHRVTDFVARYGGEEFSVILPNTDQEGATYIAEKIRKAVEQAQIPHEATLTSIPVVTLSIGVATTIPTMEYTCKQLIKQADNALYRAKNSGRNQVSSIFCDPVIER